MSSDEECYIQNREKFTVERSSELKPENVSPDFFGPALPPHLFERQSSEKDELKREIYGPILPDHLQTREKVDVQTCTEEAKERSVIGPEIPEFLKRSISKTFEEESEPMEDHDEEFGPSTNLMATEVTAEYCRSISSKSSIQKEEESSVQREEWMTQLPEKKRAGTGLIARQFKIRVQTDKESDSSVWTETPSDKGKKDNKKDHKAILEMKRLKERDKEMEKLVQKAKDKMRKKKSLLDMHYKDKKKKKKEAKEKKDVVPERRPFDRNVDLQIHRFDESKRRAIMNKNLEVRQDARRQNLMDYEN